MNRKIFDMGSNNTFNELEFNWMFGFDKPKVKEWPKWLTIPVHYKQKYTLSEFLEKVRKNEV